jgi:opacity protein-like surface antigen
MANVFLIIGLAALGTSAVCAQVRTTVRTAGRTDIGVNLYGAFSGATNGNGVQQSPSNAAGGMLELRYIKNPIVGFEGTYSFNHADQTYNAVAVACPAGTSNCTPIPAAVKANAHEVAGAWVPSVAIANLRPFAVLGGGLVFDVPSSGQASTSTTTKAVFVYGAGLDWGLLPHLGLRFQYRGNLYSAPDVTKLYTSTGVFTHTAEPMIGAYFRF